MPRTLVPAALLAGSIGPSLVDKSGTWNFSGTLQEGGQDVARISELPSSADWKESAWVVTTNVASLSSPGSLRGGTAGRVLLVGQTTQSQNGLYDYVDGSTALVRTSDADNDAKVTLGMAVMDDNLKRLWVLQSKSGNLGSGNLSFVMRPFGLEIVQVTATGDGSETDYDLDHSDVDILSVAVGGLVQRVGSGNDYEIGAGAGAGGVDQVQFLFTPGNGTNIVITYAVRG